MNRAGTPIQADQSEQLSARVNVLGIGMPQAIARFGGFALVAFQFAIVIVLLDRFQLENEAFRIIVKIAFGGFLVHHFLPRSWRHPFFLAISIVSIAYFLGRRPGGWDLQTSATRTLPLLGIGLSLIGICHLPFRFHARAALLVGAGIVIALFRKEVIGGFTDLSVIWPILGSMFMFKLMIYLYDISHDKQPAIFSRSLAYFFMIPNVCFMLFPLVDYKTFCKQYHDRPPIRVYQQGLRWMMRGVVHLVIYRLVYAQIYIAPSMVQDGTDLVRFLVTNMLLYLWVSGLFHFSIGMLHLFGFDLPETNRRYFLATSFTDYWRRVNIYWKDFIMKIVYYPAMFRMKKMNTPSAMVIATILAFTLTWLLHSYQWFWLRGDFLIRTQDAVFWSVFGTLVTIFAVREYTHGRKRTFGSGKQSRQSKLRMGLQAGATFTVITILWSFWVADSIEAWVVLMRCADLSTLGYGALTVAVIVILAILVEGQTKAPRTAKQESGSESFLPVRAAFVYCLLPAMILYIGTSSHFTKYLRSESRSIIESLTQSKPNQADQEMQVRGYYEDIMDTSRFNPLLTEVFQQKPASWVKLEQTEALYVTQDLRTKAFVPSTTLTVNDNRYVINRWGMRDKEYEQAKPEGTYRVAMLGSSLTMGWGVEAEQRFEWLLEQRLNNEFAGRPWDSYEFLNFSINGLSPVAQVEMLEEQVLAFEPDAVYFVSHPEDLFFTKLLFAKCLRLGAKPDHEFLRRIADEVGIDERTSQVWAERRLISHVDDLANWALHRIAETCRARGIEPVFIYLPGVRHTKRTDRDDKFLDWAASAGFTVITMFDLYASEDRAQYTVAPWDSHPNAPAHRIIADRLLERLQAVAGIGIFNASPEPESPVDSRPD